MVYAVRLINVAMMIPPMINKAKCNWKIGWRKYLFVKIPFLIFVCIFFVIRVSLLGFFFHLPVYLRVLFLLLSCILLSVVENIYGLYSCDTSRENIEEKILIRLENILTLFPFSPHCWKICSFWSRIIPMLLEETVIWLLWGIHIWSE